VAFQRAIIRTGTIVALSALVAACSGAAGGAGPSAVPAASAAASPVPSATEAASAAPASAGPSPKAKPSLEIDLADIGEFLTAGITLLDLADTDLAVTVTYIDPGSGDSVGLGTYTLGPDDHLSNSVPPGTYRLDFRQPPDSTTGPTCTIEVGDTDAYSFVAVTGAVAVSRAGLTPTDARELFVATSSLCGR